MFKIPMVKPEKVEINDLPTPKPNRRYLTFDSGSTVITSSTSYKTKIANRYHSIEATDVKVKDRGQEPTYQTLALLLVALRKLGKSEEVTPTICTWKDGKEFELPMRLSDFLKEADKTDYMYMKVKIGEKGTPFCFSITRGDDRVHVTTRIYHPKHLSSRNVLQLLAPKINTQLTQLDIALIRLYHMSTYSKTFEDSTIVKNAKFIKDAALVPNKKDN